MGRLSAIPRDALPAHQRRFYDAVKAIRRRAVSGPFIVLMNSSPDLAARYAHLGHYFHARGQGDESIVSLRVRAYISLIGSRALDAPYEWAAWMNWALEAGVPQDTVDAIREGRSPANLTAEEALVTEFCTQLISGNHRISDSTFCAAKNHFGVQGVVELVVTLGYFAMIALPLNAFEISMTAEQMAMHKPFAPLAVTGALWVESGARSDLPSLNGSHRTTPRVKPLATHDDVAPEHQHFLDRIVRTRGCISPAFQVLLHTPDAAERVANIGAYFLYETALPSALKLLTWLIAARELDCDYTWHAAMHDARASGLSAALIDTLEQGKPLTSASAEQRVVIDFCHQLLRGNHHVGEKTYSAAVERFGIPATVQIAAVLGYIVMMSLIANAFEIAMPADASVPAL